MYHCSSTEQLTRSWSSLLRVLTIFTKHPGDYGLLLDVVGERPAAKYIQIYQFNKLKRVEKLHRLKSQPIFSEASQNPFDFPTGISGFSV